MRDCLFLIIFDKIVVMNLQFLSSYDRNLLQSCNSSFQLGWGMNSMIHCLWYQTPYDFGFTWRQFLRKYNSFVQRSCITSGGLKN